MAFNGISKGLLSSLPSPLFFTMMQMGTVMSYAYIASHLTNNPIAPPSLEYVSVNSSSLLDVRVLIFGRLFYAMLPLGVIQLATKLMHQLALSYVSVSFVHTVKVRVTNTHSED